MKNLRNASALWLLALGLSVAFQACKPKEPEVIEPDVAALNNIQPPTVTQTQPQAVSSTVGVVAPSAAATASITALTTGAVTSPAAQQASANVQTALGTTSPTAVTSAFTPAIATSFAATGTLPAGLQAQMQALVSNPAMAAYLPTLTRPTVNGSPVSSSLPTGDVIDSETIFDAPVAFATAATANDACFAAAQAALDVVLARLDASRSQQEAVVNTAFTTRETAITASSAACTASVTQATTTRNTEGLAVLNATLTSVNSLRAAGTITAAQADLFTVFAYAVFVGNLQASFALDTAEKARCARVRTLELAEATRVRTVDLANIASAFGTTRANATEEYRKAVAVCHNQGSGN
ncbi:MAG: hypothetical protein ACK4LB_14800 [Spirosomataceae bacterium]